MQNNISDKDILYSMLEREVNNLLQGVPIFSAFGSTINSYIIKWIDPYVSAFINSDNELESEQLGEFTKEEINNKIEDFKKRYNSRKEIEHENKINL